MKEFFTAVILILMTMDHSMAISPAMLMILSARSRNSGISIQKYLSPHIKN